MRVLIAEDNKPLQVLAEDLMSTWGYDFDLANNGQEAVEYAQKNEGEYDICLMDVEMPIMNGIKATEIIRKKLKYFPIMAVSGAHHYRNECLEVGMDDFLEKLYSSKQLFAKLDELTVKSMKIDFIDDHLHISKERPMNSQQTSVLKQLKEQNLSMISIFGTSTEATFVVNEAIPQYIENEFAENKKQSVRFLDHNPEGKGLCRLFAKTSMVVKSFMLDQDFKIENQQEIAKLKAIVIDKNQ